MIKLYQKASFFCRVLLKQHFGRWYYLRDEPTWLVEWLTAGATKEDLKEASEEIDLSDDIVELITYAIDELEMRQRRTLIA